MARLHPQILAALPAFEAAARLLSFSAAARELFVTTGAISQQIKKLEQQLGVSLFNRHTRAVELTASGEELFRVAANSLESLQECLDRLERSQQQQSNSVRLKATPSFVFRWLIPRLQNFHQQHPDLRVETFAEAGVLDPFKLDYDLAIDYSVDHELPGFQRILLLEETVVPVMSPDYLVGNDWNAQDCLKDAVLLHDSMPWREAAEDAEWEHWLAHSGVKPPASGRGHYFNRVDMAIEAAAAGLGIALARSAVLADELSSGRLIAPLPAVKACCNYYLLVPESAGQPAAVDAVMNWLKATAST